MATYVLKDSQNILIDIHWITQYLRTICQQANISFDVSSLAMDVLTKLKTNNTLKEVNDQIVCAASEMLVKHPYYSILATTLLVNHLHQNTAANYAEVVQQLYFNQSVEGKHTPLVSKDFRQFVELHSIEINKEINNNRDYQLSVFGFRTLEKSYLKRDNRGKIIERPQHLYMRVAISLHYRQHSLTRIFETYDYLSRGLFIHATPTLFNAGTDREQLSSCFLLGVEDDLAAIGESWKDCAIISKYSGGIGIHMSNIRMDGAYIQSTHGRASGLKLLTVYNQIARYADQGGKRAGSIAVYVEPWHADIYYFLDLKKNTGAETERARDIFLALMINDLFMERVQSNGTWCLMCPAVCPLLLNQYGTHFNKAYLAYEAAGCYVKQINARDLWFKIMESQIETGVPYILFKDAINYKSNQINIGVINGSNLCAEIVQVSNHNEYAVCNLASLCLPKYVCIEGDVIRYDYHQLYKAARILTRNLNNVIDINFYPLNKTATPNKTNRPIGVGAQGLADVFAMFKTPFDSVLARELNKNIFETIYYGCLTESMKLAKVNGAYSTFKDSPLSKGQFQFNLWNLTDNQLSGLWDWGKLRKAISRYGVVNSLVTTCMPTASTSQIMNNNECIEPYTENIYVRTTLAGDYYIINRHLMADLMQLGLWNDRMIDLIKYYEGSIATIDSIPSHIKQIYRTAWEIPQKSIIDLAADRAPFIDQTQSMNLFIEKADFVKLNSCLFYAWQRGLKTGMYYLRSKAATNPNKFGIDIDTIKDIENVKPVVCRLAPKNRAGASCTVCDG